MNLNWLLLVGTAVLWQLASLASAQPQPPATLRKSRLEMVFSSSLFRQANRNDATPAVRLWVQMVGQKRGFEINPSVDIVDGQAEIRRRVEAGTVGILALDVVEYLQMADLPSIEPVFLAWRGEGEGSQRYFMVVREESGVSSLQALRGKNVFIHANTGANVGRMWLNGMLHDAHLDRPERYFSSMEVVTKPSAAVLPVFFGKADAAIVDGASFTVLKEMNPQLGLKLRVLHTSPRLFDAMICICSKQIEFRDALLEGMRDLHLDIQGKQILLVFKFTRLMPVDQIALGRVRDLWKKDLPPGKLPGQISGGAPLEDRRQARSGGAQ